MYCPQKSKNRTASLFMTVKRDGRWTMIPAPDKGLRDLKKGSYYVLWYEGKTRRSENVGTRQDAALAAHRRRQKVLEATVEGVKIEDERRGTAKQRFTAPEAISKFLSDHEVFVGNDGFGLSRETVIEYTRRLHFFLEFKPDIHIDDISEDVVLDYIRFLRRHERQLSDRYIYNIVTCLKTLLLRYKNDSANAIVKRLDYAPKDVRTYTDMELDRFFAACTLEEEMIFKFFLHTGGREKEIAHFEVQQLLFETNHVHFRHNRRRSFRLKSKRGRNVGRFVFVDPLFMGKLKRFVAAKRPSDLLFTNSDGGVETHFYRRCQEIAKRAGLPEKTFNLHSWRKTFATRLHNEGVPLGQIMMMLGHTTLKVTLDYLGITADMPLPNRRAFAAFA